MKLKIKTNEYEIVKLPFDSEAEIIIHDYVDDLNRYKIEAHKMLSDKIKELEDYIKTLEKHI